MSNIGKRIIQIPKNVTIETAENLNKANSLITIKGPLGSSTLNIPNGLKVNLIEDSIQSNKSILIDCIESNPVHKKLPLKTEETNKTNKTKTMTNSKIWGTFRSIIANTIIGVSQGFQVNLKIVGVGYRASLEKQNILVLKLGFSHLVTLNIPKTINISCPKPNRLVLRSNNLDELMQYAAKIRSYKEPEPYKGKGILYKGEKIRRKEGKKK